VERRLVGRCSHGLRQYSLGSVSVGLGMEGVGVWGRLGTLLGPEGTGAWWCVAVRVLSLSGRFFGRTVSAAGVFAGPCGGWWVCRGWG
jgi:hypothetical protein